MELVFLVPVSVSNLTVLVSVLSRMKTVRHHELDENSERKPSSIFSAEENSKIAFGSSNTLVQPILLRVSLRRR